MNDLLTTVGEIEEGTRFRIPGDRWPMKIFVVVEHLEEAVTIVRETTIGETIDLFHARQDRKVGERWPDSTRVSCEPG